MQMQIFSICFQVLEQWGFTVFDPAYYKNVNFTLPLSVNGTFCAFSTGYDAKGSTFLWHSMSHFNNVNVGVTGFVFDSRYTFTGLGYLAVCWQKQWGNMNSGNTDVSFNIPYTNYVIGVNFSLISNRAEAAHEREVWPMGVTLNGFKQMASASGADTNKLNWFSIGF